MEGRAGGDERGRAPPFPPSGRATFRIGDEGVRLLGFGFERLKRIHYSNDHRFDRLCLEQFR